MRVRVGVACVTYLRTQLLRYHLLHCSQVLLLFELVCEVVELMQQGLLFGVQKHILLDLIRQLSRQS